MTLRNSTNRHVNVFKREPEKTSVDINKRVVLLNRNFLSFSFFCLSIRTCDRSNSGRGIVLR